MTFTVNQIWSLGHFLQELYQSLIVEQWLWSLLTLGLVHDRAETGLMELCCRCLGMISWIASRCI
jgi:hypothetical protein